MGRDFLMALEHLWTSLPFSLPVPQSKAFRTPAASQQLSLLSLCPQTWPKGTCSWDTWAGTSEQTPRPSPHPTQRVHPPWPCATAAAPSAASPQRQVLGRRSRERHPSCCPIAIITPLPSSLFLSLGVLLTFPLCRMSANASPCPWTSGCPPSSCRSCRWRARSSPSRSAGCHGGHPL